MKKTLLLLSLLLTINVFSQTQTINGFVNLNQTNLRTSIGTVSTPVTGVCSIDIVYNIPVNGFTTPFLTFNTVNGTTTVQVTDNTVGTHTITTSITLSNPTTTFTLTSDIDFLNYTVYITSTVNSVHELNTLPIDFYSVSNSIYIQNDKNIENVKIDVFNLSGELIYSNEVSSNKIDLNTSNGLYIVKLSKDNQHSIKKVYISN